MENNSPSDDENKKVFYAEASYGQDEIDAVVSVLKNSRLSLMGGEKVKDLEKKVSSIFNKPFGLMVNSGSSANLLAFLSLKLRKGTKVITPALTFSAIKVAVYIESARASAINSGIMLTPFS